MPWWVLAILCAIVLWMLVLWTVLRAVFTALSGWKRLAERYRPPGPPPAWTWRGQTVKVGAVRYRRSMRLSPTPAGLWISEAGLLRHPTLCIPWAELHSPAATSVYGRPFVRLSVGLPPAGSLEFPAGLYQALYGPKAQ
jgi:hypothetical protein